MCNGRFRTSCRAGKCTGRGWNEPPVCPHCGGLARPNVLMFGDWDWVSTRSDAQRRAEDHWLSSIAEATPRIVVVEMGAGTAIPSVRHFGHRLTHGHLGRLVRINPREFAVPMSLDVGIPMGALEALQEIDAALCSW